ncbi:hypothetical protein [Tissierella sp.]|nr:hypothetical protein [Tissierella sp.]MDR7855053.1 hypothetical protein [Tissierella sp.]
MIESKQTFLFIGFNEDDDIGSYNSIYHECFFLNTGAVELEYRKFAPT